MGETKKKADPLLFCVFGLLVYAVCDFVIKSFGDPLGLDARLILDYCDEVNELFLALMLGTIIVLSSLGRPVKTIQFVAAGMEAFVIILYLLSPILIGRARDYYRQLISYSAGCLRASVVWMILGSAAAVGVGVLIRNRDPRTRLIAAACAMAAAAAVTIDMSRILILSCAYGVRGNVIGFLQPFCIFPFVAALSSTPVRTYIPETEDVKTAGARNTGAIAAVRKTAAPKTPTYSYLEQYRRNRKNGGEKNV